MGMTAQAAWDWAIACRATLAVLLSKWTDEDEFT